MDLSIVIVSWNVKDYLEKCLASLYQFVQGVSFEVFVVDNNSRDASAAMVASKFSEARLIANSENLGFSKANNQALKEARGRYVLLLNPDTKVFDDAVARMVEFMERHGDVACLAPQLIYPDGSPQRTCRHFPSLFTDLMENLYLDSLFPRNGFFNRYRMGDWAHDEPREVDSAYGACLLLRRDAFEAAGFLDERFFMYYDELDLCYRLKKAGRKVYYMPDIRVIHYASKSSEQALEATERYKYRSKFLFFEKHYGPWSLWVLGLTLALRSVLTWVFFPLAHAVARRPRDPGYFQRNLGFAWSAWIGLIR